MAKIDFTSLTTFKNKLKTDGFLNAFYSLPSSFKKIATNLSIIIIGAYVSATGVSLLGMDLLLDSGMKARANASAVSIGDASNTLPEIKQPNFYLIRKGVVGRNLFNSAGELPDESITEQEEKPQNTEFDLSGPCSETSLPLKLTGTIYMGEEDSLASVKDTSVDESDTYRVGDQIIDHSQAKIVKIERKRIIINNGGVKECLEVDYNPAESTQSSSPEPARQEEVRPSDRPPPPSQPKGQPGGSVSLTGTYVEEQLGEGFATVIQSARLVPKAGEGGNTEGFKAFAIKPGTLLHRVGIKNGDIITKVGDTSLKNPDQGFALYSAFQNENEFVIEIERGGSPVSIRVVIK